MAVGLSNTQLEAKAYLLLGVFLGFSLSFSWLDNSIHLYLFDGIYHILLVLSLCDCRGFPMTWQHLMSPVQAPFPTPSC